MNEIEKYFSENTSPVYKNEFQKKEASWFNGRTHFPSYRYRIATDKLQMVYDYLSNDLSQSNALFPFKSDFHLVKIRYKFQSDLKSDFEMERRSFIGRLFNKKKYQVKTSDTEMEKKLINDALINEIFTTYFDPEFSPKIRGVNKEDKYVITIRFSLIRFNSQLFNLISELLIAFEKRYVNSENQSGTS